MTLKSKFNEIWIHLFVFGFFFILYFDHRHIDILRFPFFGIIIWQLINKKLDLKFLFDPVSICIFSFAAAALISNFINQIPLNEIIKILNWLFPYYLGKYVIMEGEKIDFKTILIYLLTCAAIFAIIGIIGYLFNIQTLFGIKLFEAGHRYTFTISGTNRAGFCIGVTLIIGFYFFIKNEFRITRASIYPFFSYPIIFGSLFLIKERKTIIMVSLTIIIFLLVYKKYKILLIILISASLIPVLITIPGRYQLTEMACNKGMLGRFNAWESALGLFKEKPVFGHGYPSFKKAYSRYFHENKDKYRFKEFTQYGMAHNLNLNALAETGILGFIALNCIFFSAWRFFKYRHSEPLLFALGVTIIFIYITMQFGNFVHSATRTDMAFIIFGFYAQIEQHNRKKKICQQVLKIN